MTAHLPDTAHFVLVVQHPDEEDLDLTFATFVADTRCVEITVAPADDYEADDED